MVGHGRPDEPATRVVESVGAIPLRWIATAGLVLAILGIALQYHWVTMILAAPGRIP